MLASLPDYFLKGSARIPLSPLFSATRHSDALEPHFQDPVPSARGAKMTTFTKVADSDLPVIEIDAAKKLSKIDPMTYGGFTGVSG